METVRVDIVYRPLRICWAIKGGDKEAFRKAVRQSHALWGGRYNLIVIVDRESEARQLIEVFRADVIFPIGESNEVKSFVEKFPHLINPLFHDGVFILHGKGEVRSQILDVHNAFTYLRDRPEWKELKERGVRLYKWSPDDPLADIFLMHLGGYPSTNDLGTDELSINYAEMLKDAVDAKEFYIDPIKELPADILEHPSIAYFSRHGLERHYSFRIGWDNPGFFFGDASNLDDLVAYWNLRACDIALWFIDSKHLNRYQAIIPGWKKNVEEMLSFRRDAFPEHMSIWGRREAQAGSDDLEVLNSLFGDEPRTICNVDEYSWNGLNIRPPMMYFSEASTLGVLNTESDQPNLSFGFTNKPFADDVWFFSQHLVASLSFIGGLYGNNDYTLNPPYIPELNEFYARKMYFHYDRLRIEPNRVGIVIDVADVNSSLYALPVAELFKRVFSLAGYTSKLSSGGLITRQLITQLGGVDSARAFKIPGVRRLLRTYRPTEAFTKKSAIQLIGEKDPENPNASFKDHENLYIEPRPPGERLNAAKVFTHLVEKGLFRIGAELTCPHCLMASWIPLDVLRQKVICEMCGREFDATRQLVDKESYHYRRSGVLGGERNAQGAIPVTLTLQQLNANLDRSFRNQFYSTSLDLKPEKGATLPVCEVDFAWMIAQPYPEKTVVILAECKDRGGASQGEDGGTINAKDIENLKAVADAFPESRFDTFILLAKLCPFTPQEIELAKSLNEPHRRRAILLTDRELEPYRLYERSSDELKLASHGSGAEGLALATEAIFFELPPKQ